MEHVKESNTDQQWQCSNCKEAITDENEYIDNKGICDDCFSIPIKKRIGKARYKRNTSILRLDR